MNKKIKLFIDSADIGDIYEAYCKKIIQGCTTNPTLMRKACITDYKIFAKKLAAMVPDIPVSLEVFSDNLDDMYKEAKEMVCWGENIYIKIPIVNTSNISTGYVIKKLSSEGIKVNITAIMTPAQVDDIIDYLDGHTPSIISVFAGRIADTGMDPMPIMMTIKKMVKDHNTELLWASTREVLNIIQADKCGCDIITVSPEILKKLPMLGKNLTELSLETVKQFRNDAVLSGYKI